jgi:hypothetical protein
MGEADVTLKTICRHGHAKEPSGRCKACECLTYERLVAARRAEGLTARGRPRYSLRTHSLHGHLRSDNEVRRKRTALLTAASVTSKVCAGTGSAAGCGCGGGSSLSQKPVFDREMLKRHLSRPTSMSRPAARTLLASARSWRNWNGTATTPRQPAPSWINSKNCRRCTWRTGREYSGS